MDRPNLSDTSYMPSKRLSVDISKDHSTNRVCADKQPLTADLQELDRRLQAFRTLRQESNVPYNEEFWKFMTETLRPASDGLFAQPKRPKTCEERSVDDALEMGKKCWVAIAALPCQPVVISEQSGIPLQDVLVELLYATQAGLVDMTWAAECAMCGGGTQFEHSLGNIQKDTVCRLCQHPNTTETLDNVKVTFTFDQDILYYPVHDAMDCPHSPNAPRMEYFKFFLWVPPTTNQTKWSYCFGTSGPKAQPALEPGRYRLHCAYAGVDCAIEVAREAVDQDKPSVLLLKNSEMHKRGNQTRVFKLEHGKVQLDLLSDEGGLMIPWVYKDIPDDVRTQFYIAPVDRPKFATATDLIHTPGFKEMFGNQVVSNASMFSIQSVILVFTDVVSSTDMYEKAGDGSALYVVQDHFKIVFSAFEKRGRIVKTIGDAVMGAFTSGSHALEAVAEAQDQILLKNLRRPDGRPFEIRIGMHKGPALCVPLNGINDYFGRTVNVAARVEAQALGGECLVSDAVLDCPRTAEYWKDMMAVRGYKPTRVETVTLKGVSDPVTVQGFQSKHNTSPLDMKEKPLEKKGSRSKKLRWTFRRTLGSRKRETKNATEIPVLVEPTETNETNVVEGNG